MLAVPQAVPAFWGRYVSEDALEDTAVPAESSWRRTEEASQQPYWGPRCIWPLWGSQTSPAVQTTPVEDPGFCEARIIHPCCALPELVTHRIVSTVCDYHFRAINTQTPGLLLAGWALVDCVPLPKSLQDSLSIERLSLYSLWGGVLPAITRWTTFCHWLLKI